MNNYTIKYLPTAYNDLIDIIEYITKKLHNPNAAIRLADKIHQAVMRLSEHPYINPLYYPAIPVEPLKREYRKLIVENYILFYSVDEKSNIITITRVVYKRRDYEHSLIE